MEVSPGLSWWQYSHKVLSVVQLGENFYVNFHSSDLSHKLESKTPKWKPASLRFGCGVGDKTKGWGRDRTKKHTPVPSRTQSSDTLSSTPLTHDLQIFYIELSR